MTRSRAQAAAQCATRGCGAETRFTHGCCVPQLSSSAPYDSWPGRRSCNKRARSSREHRSPARNSGVHPQWPDQAFHLFLLFRASLPGCFGSRGSRVQISATRQGRPLEQGVFRGFGDRRRIPPCNKRATAAIPYLPYMRADPTWTFTGCEPDQDPQRPFSACSARRTLTLGLGVAKQRRAVSSSANQSRRLSTSSG